MSHITLVFVSFQRPQSRRHSPGPPVVLEAARRPPVPVGGLHKGRRQRRPAGDSLRDRPRLRQRDFRQQQQDRESEVRAAFGERRPKVRVQLPRIRHASRPEQRTGGGGPRSGVVDTALLYPQVSSS